MTENYTDIEELVPHRRPMRLVDELCKVEGDSAVTRAVVTGDWPMCKNGRADSILLIELIAQSISALMARQRLGDEKQDGRGLLVGIKKAEFFTEFLPVCARLTTRVESSIKHGNYRVFKGEVKEGPRVVGTATLHVYRPVSGEVFEQDA